MNSRAVIAALLLAATPAAAQPFDDLVEPAEPVAASYQDSRPIRKNYLIPGIELLVGNLGLNLACRAGGAEWAEISFASMGRNLTGAWEYDADQFTVDQLGHPYGGAMAFGTARSSGLGFWTSAAYAFVGSLFWEVLMETEIPSVNDQITTPVAGAFLGEVLHKWGQSVRSDGGPNPGLARRVLAAVIDPLGAANPAVFGKTWPLVPPPQLHAHAGIGVTAQLGSGPQAPLHVEVAVQHGLPADPRFRPRRPFDHFDFKFGLQASTSEVHGSLDLRGLLFGGVVGKERLRAVWGLYGSYDYLNPAGPRASVVGFGPGISAHLALGERGFAEATAVISAVPWGAAGGVGDGEGPQRDYHHGPGASQLIELALGRRGLGVIRLSARALEIDGRIVGDATEAVVVTTAGGMVGLSEHNALGFEVIYAARSANFDGATMNALDQSEQLRVIYAVTSDRVFGGGTD